MLPWNAFLAVFVEMSFADPRERVKEDDLDVVLSPQRRSFGGGCQVNVVPSATARREVSPLENKENENLRLGGGRRIGSGRIIASRVFERDPRGEKELREREPHPREREPHPRERERERDYKDKRFRVRTLWNIKLAQCSLVHSLNCILTLTLSEC